MLAIEPVRHNCGDEELRTVGVRSRIGHREQPRLGVLQFEVLVYMAWDRHQRQISVDNGRERTFKLGAVDGFTAGAVMVGKVATLEHELGDDTVECGSCVAKAILPCCELPEVPGCEWHVVVVELKDDVTSGLVVDCDLELGIDDERCDLDGL